MPEVSSNFPRVWAEFPDPSTFDPEVDEQPDTVFRCDLMWLTSAYRCIFNDGCKGIYADRPNDGCCTLGAHFTEEADIDRIRPYVSELTPENWQFHTDEWTEEAENGDIQTAIVEDACVFLNRPGFATGPGCALHLLAMRKGISHVQTKPDVCWQLPIARTYREVERKDETTYLEVSIGEFERSGWGPGGAELDWYCTSNSEAHINSQPFYVANEDELRELMGDAAYDELARLCYEFMQTPQPTFVHLATKAAASEVKGEN